MKRKMLITAICCVLIGGLMGCGNQSSSNVLKNKDAKPNNVADSVIDYIEINKKKVYVVENVKDLCEQVKDFEQFSVSGTSQNSSDAEGLTEFYQKTDDDFSNMVIYAHTGKGPGSDEIIHFDMERPDREDDSTVIKDYEIKNYNFVYGSIAIKGKTLTIGESTPDDLIKIMGEDYELNKNLELYTYELDKYDWERYNFYFNNEILSNVAIYND